MKKKLVWFILASCPRHLFQIQETSFYSSSFHDAFPYWFSLPRWKNFDTRYHTNIFFWWLCVLSNMGTRTSNGGLNNSGFNVSIWLIHIEYKICFQNNKKKAVSKLRHHRVNNTYLLYKSYWENFNSKKNVELHIVLICMCH